MGECCPKAPEKPKEEKPDPAPIEREHALWAGGWVGLVFGSAEAVMLVAKGAEPILVFYGGLLYSIIGLFIGGSIGLSVASSKNWPFNVSGKGAMAAILGTSAVFVVVVFGLVPRLSGGPVLPKLYAASFWILVALGIGVAALQAFASLFGDKVGRSRALFFGTWALNGLLFVACQRFDIGPGRYDRDVSVPMPIGTMPDQLWDKPNTLFIVVHGLRLNALSIYYPQVPTRLASLELLARDSILFEQAVSTSSATAPAMASLMTGRFVRDHGVTRAGGQLDLGVTTLFEAQQRLQIYTGAVVSHPEINPAAGFARGFDHFESQAGMGRVRRSAGLADMRFVLILTGVLEVLRGPNPCCEGDVWVPGSRQPETGPIHGASFGQPPVADLSRALPAPSPVRLADPGPTTTAAVAFLQAHQRTRWSLLVHLDMPDPMPGFDAPERYLRDLAVVDGQIQRLLDELERLRLYDDTLIVLTADHGVELSDGGAVSAGSTLAEEVLRVPLLLKMPGQVHGGTKYVGQVRAFDAFVTAMELQGVRIPKGVATRVDRKHRSLLADLGENRHTTPRTVCELRALLRDRHAYGQVRYGDTIVRSFRSSGYKLVEVTGSNPRGLPRRAFYDVLVDPGETQDLYESGEVECDRRLTQIRDQMRSLIDAGVGYTSAGRDYDEVQTGGPVEFPGVTPEAASGGASRRVLRKRASQRGR